MSTCCVNNLIWIFSFRMNPVTYLKFSFSLAEMKNPDMWHSDLSNRLPDLIWFFCVRHLSACNNISEGSGEVSWFSCFPSDVNEIYIMQWVPKPFNLYWSEQFLCVVMIFFPYFFMYNKIYVAWLCFLVLCRKEMRHTSCLF